MKRSRTFALELYPEDNQHIAILEYIKNNFEYAYILHDKDTYEEDTEEHKKGEKKKPHYHIILAFKNARTIDSIKKELQIDYVMTCNFYAYTRYLIHLGTPQKYQYSSNDIITNISLRIENALKRDYDSQEQDARILLDYIFKKSNEGFLSFRMLTEYALENGCLKELQKRSYFYNQFCDQTGFRRY